MILVAAAETAFAALLKPIMDGGFIERDAAMIKWAPGVLVIIFLVRSFGSFSDQYCIARVSRYVVYDLRALMFDRMIRLPSRYFDQHPSSLLVSKLVYDVEQVAVASSIAIRIFVKDSILCIGLLSWMAYLSWQLTLVFLVVTPIAAIIMQKANRRFRKTSEAIQRSMGWITHSAKEAFQGHRVVKAYGSYDHENERFEQANRDNRAQSMRKALVASVSVPLLIFFAGVTVAVIIYLSMSGVIKSLVSPGTFVSYLGAILLLMGPVKRLARVNEHLQTGVAAAESVFEVLDKPIEETGGSKMAENITGDIEFRNVTFQYEMTDNNALRDVSFRINRGETVALVGASGSGKTSIASLLLGFYRAQQGAILIDGSPIEDYQVEFLRSQIGFASQEAVLFDGSIESNVAYSAAQIDEKVLAEVVEASKISVFSDKLPDLLKTSIGEQGVRLSGGQRQRLTIARALYRCAPILIMDEATSALDNVSESQVKEGIKALSAERTVLIIAHRLSTVVEADRILVLQDGRVVEQGTHRQLLEMDGHYAALHVRQERGELESTDHNA